MKQKTIAVLILIGLMIFPMQGLAKSAEGGYQSFVVAFEQDGKVVKPKGHVISLQKKEFAIVITFLGYKGEPVAVKLNTSINDNYYKTASNGLIVSDLLSDGIGIAEPPAPIWKDLFLSDGKGAQYLFIDGSKSRFHEVNATDNTILGKRYVNATYFGGNSTPIQNLMVNELYLVFVKRASTGVVQQEYYVIQFPKPEFPKRKLTAEQWVQQGIRYEDQKDFSLAGEAYSRALTANPQYYDAYVRRATVNAALRRFDKALTDCDAAIAINPQDPEAYFLRADLYIAIGSEEQAAEDYSKIIAINPNLPRAYAKRAALIYGKNGRYLSKEKLLAVLADFSKVIELEPDNDWAYKKRAEVYRALREYDNNKSVEIIIELPAEPKGTIVVRPSN